MKNTNKEQELKLCERKTNCMFCHTEITEEDVYCSDECWDKAERLSLKLNGI